MATVYYTVKVYSCPHCECNLNRVVTHRLLRQASVECPRCRSRVALTGERIAESWGEAFGRFGFGCTWGLAVAGTGLAAFAGIEGADVAVGLAVVFGWLPALVVGFVAGVIGTLLGEGVAIRLGLTRPRQRWVEEEDEAADAGTWTEVYLPTPCPFCGDMLLKKELTEGWCDSCGKRVPSEVVRRARRTVPVEKGA